MRKIVGYLLVILILILSAQLKAQKIIPVVPDTLLSAVAALFSREYESLGWEEKGYLDYITKSDTITDFYFGMPCPKFLLDIFRAANLEDDDTFWDCLELFRWYIPLYRRTDESESRTYLLVKNNDDGQLIFAGIGIGLESRHIARAKKNWPEEDEYRHALVTFYKHGELIMLEKGSDLKFFLYEDDDEGGKYMYNLTRNKDGSWPLFSKNRLLKRFKGD